MTRVLILLLLLSACASLPTPQERADAARRLAVEGRWEGEVIDTPGFALQAYYPQSLRQAETVTVYIEGDGLAWIGSTTASSDPTPIEPLALRLALKDTGAAVYLGRPCQYIGAEKQPACEQKYWTSHRFSPEVIAAGNAALDQIKARFGATRLKLVGYSGGGAVAALLAARRQDVSRLVTVAGNLDHRAWTTGLRLSPLSGSLNPADFADQLAAVPQMHFVGGKDKVTGEFVARAYADHFQADHRPRVIVMPEYDHHCCWLQHWPELLNQESTQ